MGGYNNNFAKKRRELVNLTNSRLKTKGSCADAAVIAERNERIKVAKSFKQGDLVTTPLGKGKITSIDLRIGTVKVRIAGMMKDFPATNISLAA